MVKIAKLPPFQISQYTEDRFSLADWVYNCYNKYGYDIGLQIRDIQDGKNRNSQKIYYEKGDKYGQRLCERNPDDKLKLYFDDGSKENGKVIFHRHIDPNITHPMRWSDILSEIGPFLNGIKFNSYSLEWGARMGDVLKYFN